MKEYKETKAWKDAYQKYSIELAEKKIQNLQNVFTPYDLCYGIINKLNSYAKNLNELDILVLNLEFAEVLISEFGVANEKIWFVTDCKEKAKFARLERYQGIHVRVVDFAEFLKEKVDMKFDCVIMNPPYQAPKSKEHEGRGKCGASLWESFVEKSIELVKDNGYVCNIHPSRWRKPKSKIGQKIRSKQLCYLEMHGLDDGVKVFGCQSRYDWYVMQNTPCQKKTTIKDHEGDVNIFNICKMPFIPNAQLKKIMSLVAKNGEEKVELLYSRSAYGTDKANMSRERKGKFKHPCVYSINVKDEVTFWYSSKKEQFFGVPKVIFPSGAFQSVGVLVDRNGDYGLTQFGRGIVDKKCNLQRIANALRSKKFIELYSDMAMSATELDKDIIATFRKDFWKEFI